MQITNGERENEIIDLNLWCEDLKLDVLMA